jgi:GNAT superfamily N-acetyltransferase
MEEERGDYILSTDPTRLDLALIHGYLSNESYWAAGRAFEVVRRSVAHSLCFGIYHGDEQVAFARVVTDYATFAWLCDVFVVAARRGRGLGKWLVERVVAHPDLQGVRQVLLATRDAHELYRRYGGFEALPAPEKCMVRRSNPAGPTPPPAGRPESEAG